MLNDAGTKYDLTIPGSWKERVRPNPDNELEKGRFPTSGLFFCLIVLNIFHEDLESCQNFLLKKNFILQV